MISSRLGLAMFKTLAKELGWTDDFQLLVASVGSDFRATRATKEVCAICDDSIEVATPMLQQGFVAFHLTCFDKFTFDCDMCHEPQTPREFLGQCDNANRVLCKKCVDSRKQCLSCHGLFYEQELVESYCRGCLISCRECGNAVPMPKTMMTPEGNRTCLKCGRRHIWVRPYNFNPLEVLKFQGSPRNKIFFGVELEIEALDRDKSIDIAEDITKSFPRMACIKHDGSLEKGYGIEVVTAPGDMAFHKSFWAKFFDKKYEFESDKSSRCSTHVHISREPLSPLHIARMGAFFYNGGTRKFIEAIAGRSLTNEWAQRYAYIGYDYKATDFVEVYGTPEYFARKYNINRDNEMLQSLTLPQSQRIATMKALRLPRYTAMNLDNDNTVEIRIFKGTSDLTTMLKNVEFCQSVVDFCRPCTSSMADMSSVGTYKKFVIENRSIYPNLVKFLIAKQMVLKKGGQLLSV